MLLVWGQKRQSEHLACAPAVCQAQCRGPTDALMKSVQLARGRWTYPIVPIRKLWLRSKAGCLQTLAFPVVQP